jgi:hypothetical protein
VFVGFQLGVAAANILLVLFSVGTLAWFSYSFFWRGFLKRYYRLWRMRRNQMARLMREDTLG